MDKFTIDAVYYVESTELTNPIAIRPTVTGGIIWWEDTSRGTSVDFADLKFDGKGYVDSLSRSPTTIAIVSSDNNTYLLTKLTLKLYNEKLKHEVAGGESLSFKDDKSLQSYYLKTNFYA